MEHHMKYTEAQLEAQNLAHSLAQHQQREEAIEKQAEVERFRQMRLQKEIEQFNQHQYAEQQAAHKQSQQVHHQPAHGQSELQQSESDVNLDESVLNTQQMGHKAVQKLQAQLEAKVQKELDELTVIANNEYAGGKHTYDYQLVRLSEGQKK
jgi:hypothetical protein